MIIYVGIFGQNLSGDDAPLRSILPGSRGASQTAGSVGQLEFGVTVATYFHENTLWSRDAYYIIIIINNNNNIYIHGHTPLDLPPTCSSMCFFYFNKANFERTKKIHLQAPCPDILSQATHQTLDLQFFFVFLRFWHLSANLQKHKFWVVTSPQFW